VYHDTVATVATVAVATCTVPGKKSSIGKRFHLHVRLLFWQASCDQKLKNNFLLLFASMKLQAEDRFQFLEAFLQKPKLLAELKHIISYLIGDGDYCVISSHYTNISR